jgi:hypothetical protein
MSFGREKQIQIARLSNVVIQQKRSKSDAPQVRINKLIHCGEKCKYPFVPLVNSCWREEHKWNWANKQQYISILMIETPSSTQCAVNISPLSTPKHDTGLVGVSVWELLLPKSFGTNIQSENIDATRRRWNKVLNQQMVLDCWAQRISWHVTH